MASIEEDEDLIALRSAVLASMKVKPKEKEPIEEDAELLALRQAALQSKRQQNSAGQHGPKHTEQLAISKIQSLAAPYTPASPKQFHGAAPGWNNLIVIPLQEPQAPPRQPRPPHAPTPSLKPTLLRPQDKWAGGGGAGSASAAPKEKKATSKFSRFESHDSDSEEEDEEDEDGDKGEEVDLLEKQIEQFLQGSDQDSDHDNDQDNSGNENGHIPAIRADSDHSGDESAVVKSKTDHPIGGSPREAASDGEGECVVREAEVEQREQITDSAKCCDINSVEDQVVATTEVAVRSRSPSHSRSSSSSSSGSSSSSQSSGSSSSWSSSMSSGSGSRPQSISPKRHKSPVSPIQKVSSDTKPPVESTVREPLRPPGERRGRKTKWEHGTDLRSVSLKVGGGQLPKYGTEHHGGRHDPRQDTQPPGERGRRDSRQATQPPGEVSSRRHPKDRLGHRTTPTLDAPKDAREKLEDRKRKFASNKVIQPDKRGTTIVLKNAVPSGKVATDKENRQSNVKQRLGAHSRKDDRTRADVTNPGNARTKLDPCVTTVKEKPESFNSDDLSDSSDSFSFSDSDSEDAANAPWRQKNTIERDEMQINRERYIRRRNDRCIDAVLVAPTGGARVQELRHRGRQRRHTPPRARHVKRDDKRERAWPGHRGDSGSDGERDTRSLRSVMSVVKKNTDSADANSQGRSRSTSRTRDHKWRKRKDDLVVVDVRLDEPSKSVVVREEGSVRAKGRGKREEDARSIIQRLKRKGPMDVEVELAVKEVKKAKKSPPVADRVSPTINITFNKDAEMPKSDARMSVHERLGLKRKSRRSKKSTPPPLEPPPKPGSSQLESQVHGARKVIRYDGPTEDSESSRKGTNGSHLMEGKAIISRKHKVATPVEKEMYSTKKTSLVLKTGRRRDHHKSETREHVKRDHSGPDHIPDKKETGPLGNHYESELDAKIRKIKEKNDQIMRRKRQIEEDKKKYG